MSTIRQARAADAAALADLAAATFALACPPDVNLVAVAAHVRSVLAVEHFAQHLADPTHLILVAEDQSAHDDGAAPELAGFTMLVFAESEDADVLASTSIRPAVEISKFYLRAGSHGTGLAGELMTAALQAARERGSAGAWLGVYEFNVRAQRFYIKHGFATVGTKFFRFDGQNETDLVLERAL